MNSLLRQVRLAYSRSKARFLLLLGLTVVIILVWQFSRPLSEIFVQSSSVQSNPVPPSFKQSSFVQLQPKQSKSSPLFNWRNVNIQGMGYVTGLTIAPLSPHDVYVRTDVGGAYRFDVSRNVWLPLLDKFDTNFAKGGVGVESVAVDPQQAQRVYVAINRNYTTFKDKDGKNKYKYGAEVMVSENRGVTWTPTGLAPKNVFLGPNQVYRSDTGERIAIDPNKSGLIYFASRRDGLWKKDGQQDWSRVSGGLPNPSTLPEYKLPNGTDNPDVPGFTFVLFDKRSGKPNSISRVIYVGVHGSGVWSSANGGQSWTNIGGGVDPVRGAIATDGTLYVSFGTIAANGKPASGGVRKYTNNNWTDITPDGKDKVYAAVTVQADQPNTVMAIFDRYVYRSTNGGKNWNKQTLYMGAYDANEPQHPVNPSAPPYYQSYSATGAAAIAINPGNSKQVWWTNGWGVARTDDVTVSNPAYQWVMQNLEELDSNLVRVPPKPKAQGGADLLSAVQDKIGFRHVDRNQVPSINFHPVNIPINPAFKWANPNWRVYPVPFPHVAGATGMDYSYKNPDYAAFVGAHQWQFWPVYGMTKDNGKTWQAFESIPAEKLWKPDKSGLEEVIPIGGQIAMSPTNPQNMVWAPTWGGWPHYTTDGGKTWNLTINKDHPPQPKPYDPKNNDHTHYNVLPKAWANSISPWLSAYILASDRQDPQGKTFYYYDGWTFYYSKDGGANWQKGASGTLPQWLVRPAIVSNPTQAGDVWMSFARNPEDVNSNKLYRSTDGGKTFSAISTVDSCEFITFGKGDAEQKPYIYIFGRVGGAKKDTIYKSVDMAKTWIAISDPNTQSFPGLTYLEGDMRSLNLVYAAVSGRGIIAGEGGR
ncbi:sialidase family protein [Fortiea contorta]|uniref:sialidase family protein n=1 Tax=Fortiea contorta TaxID=1892405 RepID=UPI00036F9015|nr:sialidase family protein [Fortiea contorta]